MDDFAAALQNTLNQRGATVTINELPPAWGDPSWDLRIAEDHVLETMVLGLGAGVCFYYVPLDGQAPSRFTNGRVGRLEVTALGDAVNECSRIQESARDGEILVSNVVRELASGKGMAFSEIGDVVAKYRELKAVRKSLAETREILSSIRGEDDMRELAEIVRDTVPGCELEFAGDASPDTRNYRVDCSKIARALPNFAPQ